MDKEFIEAVKMMRNAQKEYFLTRNPYVLLDAKKYEKRVDRMIEEMQTENLFNNGKQE